MTGVTFGTKKSSVFESALVCATCPVSMLMRAVLIGWVAQHRTLHQWHRFLIDFLCIAVPGVLCMTIFSTYQDIYLLSLFAAGVTFLILLLNKHGQRLTESQPKCIADDKESLLDLAIPRRRHFVTYFRAYTLLAAVIAIMGVDFYQVFPRRFRKREKYGVGLMDVGVGGFMVANGIVCKETRVDFKIGSGIKGKFRHIGAVCMSTIPLWFLGCVRAAESVLTGYHVHPSEYGLHWNFFFTLAVVQILSTTLLTLLPAKYSPFLAVIIGLGYQYILQVLEVRQFVLKGSDGKNSREGFLNANREGIFSCIGYLSIYLACAGISRYLSHHKGTFRDWLKAFIVLVLIDCVFWMILNRLEPTVEAISRRMANLGYIVWMMAHQLFLLCGFFLVDLVEIAMAHSGIITPTSHTNSASANITQDEEELSQSDFSLMEAVNRNGLVFFVLANVLTALVNVTMETNKASAFVGITVLIGFYMFTLCFVASIMHVRNITISVLVTQIKGLFHCMMPS